MSAIWPPKLRQRFMVDLDDIEAIASDATKHLTPGKSMTDAALREALSFQGPLDDFTYADVKRHLVAQGLIQYSFDRGGRITVCSVNDLMDAEASAARQKRRMAKLLSVSTARRESAPFVEGYASIDQPKTPWWVSQRVRNFIHATGMQEIFDPFSDTGSFLEDVHQFFPEHIAKGYRTVTWSSAPWPLNPSLVHIPRRHAVLVTVPPTLNKRVHKLKGCPHREQPVPPHVLTYYDEMDRDDLYQVALDRCMEASRFTVAILPEHVLRSSYPMKSFVFIEMNRKFRDTHRNLFVVAGIDTKWIEGPMIFCRRAMCGRLATMRMPKTDGIEEIPFTFKWLCGSIVVRLKDLGEDHPIEFLPEDRVPALRMEGIHNPNYVFVGVPRELSKYTKLICIRANIVLDRIRRRTWDIVFDALPAIQERADVRRVINTEQITHILRIAIHECLRLRQQTGSDFDNMKVENGPSSVGEEPESAAS